MSKFKDAVIFTIQQVPYGKVASYGQIAAYVGIPRAARQVGWILNQNEGKIEVPWWRIVNNAGRITIKGCKYSTPALMKQLLEEENVKVSEDYSFDIEKYRFRPDKQTLKTWQLTDEYIETVCSKYNL
jgi:methylated-DNA-protein-cysteine methyltransferase related protein